MPCKSYGLPALACKVGGFLHALVGSICWHCYALKGMYQFPAVQEAQQKRLESLTDPLWVDALVTLIGSDPFFRWHDSGDIQGLWHLTKIVAVCKRTPKTQHWMPTRERKVVEEWISLHGRLPRNLTVRMSAVYFDSPVKPLSGTSTTSGSHKDKPPLGFACPAPSQNGTCSTCRACWSKAVKHVSYHHH